MAHSATVFYFFIGLLIWFFFADAAVMVSKKCQIICLTSSGYFWHKTIRGFYSNIITSKLEIRKSHDLAKDSGGTASKAEKKICKSKTDCELSIET